MTVREVAARTTARGSVLGRRARAWRWLVALCGGVAVWGAQPLLATPAATAALAKQPSAPPAAGRTRVKIPAFEPPTPLGKGPKRKGKFAGPPPAPAKALPADATLAVSPPTEATLAVAPPGAATPTTELGPPRARSLTAPVATAWALPQEPAARLESDVKARPILPLIRAGQFAEALVETEALLLKAPKDDELRLQKARLLYWLDRRGEARSLLTELQASHPDDVEVRELDAQLRLADGDLPGALAQYRWLQVAGDGRPELHQRIIDLALELEQAEAVAQALKFGGSLSPEQEMTFARLVHPWFSDVAVGTTLHSGIAWWRGDVHLGRRLSKRFSVLAGGIIEQRYAGQELERAESFKGELFFGFSRLDGMLHVEGSPNRTFLPAIDGRLDVTMSLVKALSLGLYGRYAAYRTPETSQTLASSAWTLAPNLVLYVNEWTLQPGYMLVHLRPNPRGNQEYFHTGYAKVRWEPSVRWSAFAWLYLGTDPTFIERYGVTTATGTSFVLGGEHWWTPRWGTRLSASRIQPFDSRNDPYTDVTLVLRGRL